MEKFQNEIEAVIYKHKDLGLSRDDIMAVLEMELDLLRDEEFDG